MKPYQKRKEAIRKEVEECLKWCEENDYCYGELYVQQEYFYQLGKRYGLLKEFRKNEIIYD